MTDPRTGEIKTIVHSSDTNVGSAAIPANLTVYGSTSVVSQSAQYLSASTIQVKTLVDASGSNYVDQTSFGLRLSLSSSNPVPSSNVPSGSTLYLTPYTSGRASVYNGTQWVNLNISEVSKTLSCMTSDKNYDVFLFLSGNTVAIELSAAWTNDTTRSEAISRQDGVYVKSSDQTRRYVGTIRSVSSTAVSDSQSRRFVWNYYNRVERSLKVTESADSWIYNTAAFRPSNNNIYNSFEFVTGDSTLLAVRAQSIGGCSGGAAYAGVGIGIDSTTVNSADVFGQNVNTLNSVIPAEYRGRPSVGYHRITWLEAGGGVANMTWFGDAGQPTLYQMGMIGFITA